MDITTNSFYEEAGNTAFNTPMPMPIYGMNEMFSEASEMNSSNCDTPVMAFIPVQKWRELYDAEKGFDRGTIFQEIDLPFLGEGGR